MPVGPGCYAFGGSLTSYGYRIFVVDLFQGMSRKQIDFAHAGGRHYREVAVELLSAIRGRTVLDERRREPGAADVLEDATTPDIEDDDPILDPLMGKRALSLELLHAQDAVVYGEVLVGKYGDHESALGAPQLVEVDDELSGEPELRLSLAGRAPARRFRFMVNLPNAGKFGIVVVEDISRSCPIDPLVRQLRYRSQDAAAAVKSAKPASGTSEPGATAPWWRPSVTPAIDDDHFSEMIRQGKLDRVELVRHSIGSDGQRSEEQFRLTASRPEALTSGAEFIALIREWVEDFRRRREGPRTQTKRVSKEERAARDISERLERRQTDQEAAGAMAALLGENIQSIEFDDGWVVMKDGDRTKKVSPSRISELFTYELDRDRRPSDLDWYSAARTTALRLATPLRINLEWPATLDIPAQEDA